MENNQPMYKAVITLASTLVNDKEEAEPTTIELTLYPADTVEIAGTKKRLGDCTLAELAQFADRLEEAWATEVASDLSDSLAQLAQAETPLISVELDCESEADWVEQWVVLEDEPESSEDSKDSSEILPHAETESETETEADDTAEPIPITISTSEPELIHAEREAQSRLPQSVTDADRTAGDAPLPNFTQNATLILLDEKPLRKMQAHADTSLNREVAGVMVGPTPEKQPDGRYTVHITDMIIAKHTRMSGASVTYTPESWRYLNDQLHNLYPKGDHVMVGWYHTHPGFGIFLSGMDMFIHTNFFTQKWHIAYVLDPVGKRTGFFSWNKEQDHVITYHFPWPDWAAGSW